ncbi:MAG TPA: hypothetical protein VIU13_01150, partial [Chryseolinea sp.]
MRRISATIRVIAIFFLCCVSIHGRSQSIANSNKCFTKPDKLDGHEVFSAVNKEPEYPGGLAQFYKDVLK